MSGARIAFCAPPFAGHLNPLVPLAEAASRAGHEVEIVTGAAKVAVLRGRGLNATSLDALGTDALERIADTPHRVGANLWRLAGQMRAAFAVMAAARDELLARWRVQPPDLVVADFMAVAAGLAADRLGLPWITTLPTPFALEGRRGPPSYLGGLRPMKGPIGRARDTIGWAAVRSGKDALAWRFRGELTRLGLPARLRLDGSEAIYSPTAILALGLAELEFDRDWPSTVRFLGPVADNPEPPLLLTLPGGRPRVLVTLGTHLPWAKARLVEQVRALGARLPDVQFVVSLGRPREASREPLLAEDRLTVFAFAPYAETLPAVDAVIHHGGAGVTGACIAAGAPSLVAPQDYDQFDYAARVAHHRLGLTVRRIDSAEAAARLRRLLDEPWPALPVFAAHAARYRPAETFLEVVARTLGDARSRLAA